MEENNSIISLSQAVEAIKTAILQGQYEAAKDVNRVLLAFFNVPFTHHTRIMALPDIDALKSILVVIRKFNQMN